MAMTDNAFAPMLDAARAWCAGTSAPPPAGTRALAIAAPDLPVGIGALTGAAPGALYELRSPGALVPPAAESGEACADAAFAAGLDFGLGVFAARHVLVLTHTACGLIEALTAEADGRSMAFARSPALARFAAAASPAIAGAARAEAADADRRRRAAMELVRMSVENLMGYPALLDAVMGGGVALHGWVLDTDAGALWTLDPAEDAFRRA